MQEEEEEDASIMKMVSLLILILHVFVKIVEINIQASRKKHQAAAICKNVINMITVNSQGVDLRCSHGLHQIITDFVPGSWKDQVILTFMFTPAAPPG